MSKIAIAILAANNDLSERNCNMLINTYIKTALSGELNNEYKVFFYVGDETLQTNVVEKIGDTEIYRIKCACADGIKWTFEKTIIAYDIICNMYDFDVMLRSNISTYVNIRLFDRLVSTFDDDKVYCNTLNTAIGSEAKGEYIPWNSKIYPRGDFYIMSRKVVKGVLAEAGNYMDARTHTFYHVDDVLVGLCIADFFGDDYYRHLHTLYYGFFPYDSIPLDDNNIKSIAYRVKSIPKGVLSGWSQADNEFRKLDVEKMKVIDDNINAINEKLTDITSINDLLLNDSDGNCSNPKAQHPIHVVSIRAVDIQTMFSTICTINAQKNGR